MLCAYFFFLSSFCVVLIRATNFYMIVYVCVICMSSLIRYIALSILNDRFNGILVFFVRFSATLPQIYLFHICCSKTTPFHYMYNQVHVVSFIFA